MNLQDRLERIELGRLSFEIQGWCSRELLHAAKAAGGVGTHFRDVFLSMPLEDQYRLRERQTRDEGQVLPMVKKESSDG